ncbi:2-deoxy-D-gluconate 3-dehydrogenase [Clostridiales bacterium PH28_bin88]|nr:2-deoxy-D-gluconate 3-dehydrogenase [Clostridiales bacterium PH28_bin88]
MGLPGSDLAGKVAIVTGGSKGIGYGIARALAEAGVHVVVVSRNLAEGEQVAQELAGFGIRAVARRADVTNKGEVEDMVASVVEDFGRIDILINNAGMNIRKALLDLAEEEWDRVINTNLKGIFLVGQAVGRVMVKQKKGKIINIASVAGVKGRPFLGAYCSSKGAVIQLTRVMALEWVKDNVQVNAIGPSYIETPMTADWIKVKKDEILQRIPMGRLGTMQDLAGAVIYLASEASDFVTGQAIFVDGGSTA